MEEEMIRRYIPIVDEISLKYQYDHNIKHLLYLIIPAFIEKYGKSNERRVLDVFFKVKIEIREDNMALEEAYYTSIPYRRDGKIMTVHFIVLRKYSTNSLIQLLDNLVHEFNHAIHSIRKEVEIMGDIFSLRTGLTRCYYYTSNLEVVRKENTYLLEEILNTIQTEEIINRIKKYSSINDREIMNTVWAINHEVLGHYQSKSYYLETVLFQHILKNRTFTSTLNHLRLSGDIDDIEGWFDNITGVVHSYQNLNDYLVKIMALEMELVKRKYFKGMVISKIRNLLDKCFLIIDTFNQNCHYK